ncbi:MAG: GNAT family N-acetyltransferase [Planctomycetota bacterium]|jgi:GNAT superfamily N-acetyltransferase
MDLALPGDIIIRPMTESDTSTVGRLHRDEISRGFMSQLGSRFLKHLYLGILHSGLAQAYVAEDEGRVIGFAVATSDVNEMYRRVLADRRWRFVACILPRVFSPSVVRYCWENLRYPSREEVDGLPNAELLAIAVDDRCTGKGIGRRLMDKTMSQLWAQGVTSCRVMVLAALERANAFYPRVGYDHVTTIDIHGRATNVYVARPQDHQGGIAT